jgi:hypothetical protein
MKAKKFEQQFDDGVDITASLDLSKPSACCKSRSG